MKVFPAYRKWLRHKRIAFDTSFLIMVLEGKGREAEFASRIMEITQKRKLAIISSTVTLLEALVRPYRAGATEAVNQYYGHLVRSAIIRLVPLTVEIADRAACLRARYGLKTSDAIQLATAVSEKATLFLACDKDFRKQKEIEVGLL